MYRNIYIRCIVLNARTKGAERAEIRERERVRERGILSAKLLFRMCSGSQSLPARTAAAAAAARRIISDRRAEKR